jgi:hypothetical protein
MLANAALAFYLAWSGGKIDESFVAGVVYALALGLLALLLALRPRGFVVVLARGVAIAIIITLVVFALFSGAVFALGVSPTAWLQAAIGLVPLAIQVLLLRALPLSDPNPSQRIFKNVAGAGLAFFLTLMLSCVSQIGKNVTEFATLSPRIRADSVMRSSVARVQACAVAFAREHGGYPASLAEMGPRPSGTGCLDEAHAAGKIGAVTLKYVAAAPDSVGLRRAFQVFSSGHVGYQHGEPWMAFGDETGIFRSGDSAATPSAIEVIHGGMLPVRTIRACANLRRLAHPATGYPRDWNDVYEVRETDTQDANMRWLGCYYGDRASYVNLDTTHAKVIHGARYTPIGDSVVTDYVLEIRPRIYGVTGVRSLRTTARGPVHTTVEDRAATDDDPVVPTCAYEIGDQTCAPEAGGVPASVDVVIPDTVAHGDTFAVKITDTRPPSRVNHPYQYAVLCNYRKFAVNMPKPPTTYSFTPPAQCVADSTRAESGWVIVRVWVRDYSTTETSIYRRAHLPR